MKTYSQLTQDQRYQIYASLVAGWSQEEIAHEVGCHPSTISRELKRNKGKRGYRPRQAHSMAKARQEGNTHAVKFCDADFTFRVDPLITAGYSPEQAAARLAHEGTLSISHESIYLHLLEDKAAGGELYKSLRCQKQRRKRYGSGHDRRGKIPGRVPISKRGPGADNRSRFGHGEVDCIVGRNHKGIVVSVVDRKSRYGFLARSTDKRADVVAEVLCKKLRHVKDVFKTLTFDNGLEFANHKKIATHLDVKTFFCDPYSSWQRGTNENFNGLVRQYLPKGTDLRTVTDDQLAEIEDRLNHRPRKVLGWLSPYEVFHGVRFRYTC